MEVWIDIEGYEGRYKISSFGRVKSLDYRHTGKEQILKLAKDKDGYLLVTLCKNGINKTPKVHRLVAQAFIPNPNNYPHINHKDENKTNNRIENLEWCTSKYNCNYGTWKEKRIGSKNPISRKVRCVTTNKTFESIREAAKFYNMKGEADISKCCKGKLKSAGSLEDGTKLIWEYIGE